MEFLSKIAEYTIEPVGRLLARQVGYVIHCKTNLQNLQANVEELKAAREAVQNKVAEAERKGKDIQPDVQLWLTKVGEITAQADELIRDESQAKLKCLRGFCPNLAVRHQLSRKSTKLLQDVADQYEKREFSEVSCGVLRNDVWSVTTGDYQAFESRMSIVKEIMDSLKDPDIQRIGVYGIGGVGKTTLVKEVYKQASADKMLFEHVVILLDVKSTPDPEAIQKKIIEMLGMGILENETIEGRASRLCANIQGKKILVILDDVQEKTDLEVVGLPRLPACKILVTCRTRDILSFDKMCADKAFQLQLLGKDEVWSLFVKMAGDVVKQKGRIQDVAVQVADKCGGLPSLVVTVASALKGKNNLREWKDALRRLTNSDKKGFTEKAYLTLEWSYNQLDDEELKQLFLLSGIIVNQNNIPVQLLLKYGVGLGFFTNVSTLEEARNALDTLLGKLKDSCLLLDGDTEGFLRMPDLVCHVAKLIAYRDHHMLSIDYGDEFKEWPNENFLKKCSRISLIHSNIPTFPDIPMECPELELFYLHSTEYFESVQSNFFSEMKKLRVLGLTNMYIPSLPLSLQYLKELQTLCMDGCSLGDITLLGHLSSLEVLSLSRSYVKELPKEIGQLTSLRLLDLSYCDSLKTISPNVISRLVKLEVLNMRDSFKEWEVEGKGNNATLSELKQLSQLSSLEIHIPNVEALPANLFPHKLERFNIYIGDAWDEGDARSPWEQLSKSVTLNTLKLKLTKELDECTVQNTEELIKNSEYLSLDETEVAIVHELNAEDFEYMIHLRLQNNIDFMAMVNKKVVFPKLETLWVHGCDNLKFLFSFSMAESLAQLTHLKVSKCKLLQEIVSSIREDSEESTVDMFFSLEVLKLEELPNLVRFSTGEYIEVSSLVELEVMDCDNLGVFIGGNVSMSRKDTRSCNEIEPTVLEEEENIDIKSDTAAKNFLFDKKVVFPNLKTLWLHGCDNLKILFSFSMAKSLAQLTHLKVSKCKLLQEIVSSIREDSEESTVDMFSNLEVLKLEELPNLVRFSTGEYIEFPSLVQLVVMDCDNLGVFLGGNVSMSRKDARSCNEIEPTVLEEEENIDVKSDTATKNFLFDKKVVFPNLKTLWVHGCDNLKFLFSFSMAKSLAQLTHLKVSKCKLLQEIVSSIREDSEESTVDMFSNLEVLKLEELPNLVRFSTGEYIEFPSLVELVVMDCDNLGVFIGSNVSMSTKDTRSCNEIEPTVLEEEENIDVKSDTAAKNFLFDKKVVFPDLETLWVHGCNNLKFLFSFSMAKSLVQLTHLKVSKCKLLQEIVSSTREDGEDGTGEYIEFSSLVELEIKDCDNLEVFIGGKVCMSRKDSRSCNEIEPTVLEEEENIDFKSETFLKNFLFNEKVGLPRLERLAIIDLPEVTTIWCSQPAVNSFCKLTDVTVRQCSGLKNIFPESTIAIVSQHLQKLIVEQCGVTEIFALEDVPNSSMPDQVVFADVTSLEFRSLLQLKSFYPRTHAFKWPKLEKLVLSECPDVGIFASEFKSQDLHSQKRNWGFTRRKSKELGSQCPPVKQSIVLIEQSSFPILEYLTLSQPSLAALRQEAVFVGINSRHTDGTRQQIRLLRLHGMKKLLRLSSSEQGQIFPELELLELKYCGFNNLELSVISFRNLTNLELTFCWRLHYLTTCSVAQNLVQLRRFKVDECKRMTEILANDGIGERASTGEIVFGNLQHLELSDLISLERFCSRNYTVRVPPLLKLVVKFCPVKFQISTAGVLDVVSDVDVWSPSRNKEVVDTSESPGSLETHQKQSTVSNVPESAPDTESSAREILDDGIISEPSNGQQTLL